MRQATTGETVLVHYTGTLDDGTEFDSSKERGPIEVNIGGGQVIAGFEEALMGMSEGEAKNVTLAPEAAYGPHMPERIHVVERERIPPDIDLAVGAALLSTAGDGTQMRLLVVALDDDEVTLDANHPLAGQALSFALTQVGFVG
jgi:peptidylprolyl isomerase